MERFHLERRKKDVRSTFFPEAISKEGQNWGQAHVGTSGQWLKYRLILGPILKLRKIIQKVAREYSPVRNHQPLIDQIKLFDEMPRVRATGLEYYDYCGRIDTISRESVVVIKPGGAREGLNRDIGCGFRGIIVQTEEPWSMEKFVEDELLRTRIGFLNRGVDSSILPDLTTKQPWALRDALEHQITDLQNAAWLDYINEPTIEKLEVVIGVERHLYEYLVDGMRWAQLLGHWEHEEIVPFPDRSGALELWEKQAIRDLHYDQTEPWWLTEPTTGGAKVTAIRKAYLSTGRVNIQITTNPSLYAARHRDYPAIAHHLLTYDPIAVGMGIPQSDEKKMKNNPFQGSFADSSVPGWQGIMTTQPGWASIQGEGPIPEPTLEVKTRPVSIPAGMGERLEAAMQSERPALVFEHFNQAVCPMLVLPRMFFNTRIVPLFEGGRVIRPIEEHNTIDGWATLRDNGPNGVVPLGLDKNLFSKTPFGFVQAPISGRPIREGAIQEILPYA